MQVFKIYNEKLDSKINFTKINFSYCCEYWNTITIKIQGRISDNNCFKLLLRYVCFITERRGLFAYLHPE